MGARHGEPLERFWRHVEVVADCWLWTAYTNKGYARFNVGGKVVDAHRWAYEHFVGPVPAGAELDHSCHTRAVAVGLCGGGVSCPHRRCVNPAHLEPVTSQENSLRGAGFPAQRARTTHCPRGHEYTPENTYRRPDRPRTRECLTCKKATAKRSAERAA